MLRGLGRQAALRGGRSGAGPGAPHDLLHPLPGVHARNDRGGGPVVTHESPAPEDEAWDHVDQESEWFYIVRFKQKDLWPEYPEAFANDTLQTEILGALDGNGRVSAPTGTDP